MTTAAHNNDSKPRRKKVCIILIVIAVFLILAAFDVRLITRKYVIDAPEIVGNIKIAFVADLHSCNYGSGQNILINTINTMEPDLILLGGDIFDDELPNENTELFLAGIANRYPCYYVSGNHEYWGGSESFSVQMSILQKYGVTILSGDYNVVSIRGESINICGIDDPDAFYVSDEYTGVIYQLESLNDNIENDFYTVLLAHRPEYFDVYSEYDFDLVLCGHAHGGQWRIPLILNGLFAPNQGMFPEYAGGQYTQSDSTMIVSRGLARESTRVPRLFNRPELLLIELK